MKEPFIIYLDEEFFIDLRKINKTDWEKIKNDVKFFMQSGHTKDIGKAYIAAFFVYLEDIAALSAPFDPDKDLFN